MDKKVCGDCKIEKPLEDFPLRKKKNKNTGVVYTWPRLQCYACMRIIYVNRYKSDPKKYIKRSMDYEAKNKDKKYKNRKAWEIKNRKTIAEYKNKYEYDKTRANVGYLIQKRLRSRVRAALVNKSKKAYRTMELVGCTMDFLMKHIEELFLEGMSWDNVRDWHIDHKKPCVLFDLTNEQQQKECFNWKNLQPLWGIDNLKKGAKYKVS